MANKLELTWVGKDEEIKVEPRILIENPELSNISHKAVGQASLFDAEKADGFDNMLIHGDNLLALKALESKFAGQVKCIYIDPPYNTGSAFEHYDDGIEHSIWLNLMYNRLLLLKNLLHKTEGTIWITLDDNEAHYAKIICDGIWGRNNFIGDVIWNSRKSVSNDAILSLNTNHILVYASNIDYIRAKAKRGELFRGDLDTSKFANPDNDPRGPWVADPFDAPAVRANLSYEIKNPNTGVVYTPPKGRHWRTEKEKYDALFADNRIVFGKNGDSKPQQKRFLSECLGKGAVLTTLWDDLDTTTNATKHSQTMFVNSFTNPKPENLIERILKLSTKPGDLVLDSFLGSGTTAAVAQKMGRKWIGVEMGDQAYDFCKVRLDKVIDGSDQGGITKSVNWKGGGGYRFYELAPTLVVTDKFGNPVINKEYNADMLAAAMALQEGFTYCPDDTFYWKQGKNENAYIFTTTSHVTADYLASIHSEMQDDEYLVIACKAYDSGIEKLFKNITVKKIPQVLLGRCEFGKNDYSLNIVDMPSMEEE